MYICIYICIYVYIHICLQHKPFAFVCIYTVMLTYCRLMHLYIGYVSIPNISFIRSGGTWAV